MPEDKEKDKDLMPVLSIIATLLPTVVAFGASTTGLRIAAIVLYIIIAAFVYNYQHKKTELKKKVIIVASVFEMAIVISSIVDVGSFAGYLGRIKSFVFVENEADNERINKSDLDEYYASLENSIEDIDNMIASLNEGINQTNENIYLFDDYVDYIQSKKSINRNEVEEIVLKIEEITSANDDYIYNFRTDRYFVQLYYKMFLAENPWYYCNILEAFEEYGIDVDNLEIDEHVLLTWDIHLLYNTFNMKERNIPNLNSDNIIDCVVHNYNDNRMNTEKYSDAFNYAGWCKSYENKTGDQINGDLNIAIDNLCEKIIMNCSN